MPVRFRITLIFSLLVAIILAMVCAGIYYFSYQARLNTIKTRLTNRAITTARLLSQRETFDRELVRRIDAATTIALNNKSVEAYNSMDDRIYRYSDLAADTLSITVNDLATVRFKGQVFVAEGKKEMVGYHYSSGDNTIDVFVAGEDAEGRQSLQQLRNILLFGFVSGIILVVVIGYFFSRGLLRPIQAISDDTRDISAQNLTRRIHTGDSRDEWYQLSTTLNALLDRLQESFEMQRRFIANASHELSTPLTAISSQLEIALSRERAATEYKQVMESIFQDVQHLCKLTQTLLEFAKASGDPGGLEISLVRMDEIVLRLPAEATRINPDYAVTIDFENLPEQEEQLLVFGNEPLLLTALKNIVLNACKYAPDQNARVVLAVQEHAIVIEVQDKGPGIDLQERNKVFQPFYRIAGDTPKQGFGLGLPLAERIIKIHKGTIDLIQPASGGSLFQIVLPSATRLGNV
ncbi:Signal transduction histidine kinase [Cnuella takakiae]|uniref:histidine kinase n=1 Tax=Cnuella takakiae TaxID=1302690 RepID=A0A1M5IYU6_9BACT|nr:HAMP domain-containing sensor histidine kinase [Cnuella takakiae]OLY91425.1 two-component sensor histidine kinase [Cnuella takakiae]SHG32933.1 Signal transduction histidine kinase [Cnuella takakiae]